MSSAAVYSLTVLNDKQMSSEYLFEGDYALYCIVLMGWSLPEDL